MELTAYESLRFITYTPFPVRVGIALQLDYKFFLTPIKNLSLITIGRNHTTVLQASPKLGGSWIAGLVNASNKNDNFER